MSPKNSDSIPSSEPYESSRQPLTLAERRDLILNAGSPLTSSNGRNNSHGKIYEKTMPNVLNESGLVQKEKS